MSPRVVRFNWDAANLAHIARHAVEQSEVEEAFVDPLSFLVGFELREGEMRYRMIGVTHSDRTLTIAYIIRDGAVRAVTAHDSSRRQRRLYAEARRHHEVGTSKFRF